MTQAELPAKDLSVQTHEPSGDTSHSSYHRTAEKRKERKKKKRGEKKNEKLIGGIVIPCARM